ncbi:alpha/beta fold hydrolase [Luteipulveratus halotolerans]|uniref:Alpha/beta hydrolase n=1 Tax=Luteipulveratus halotolerans TaxID=1631356 RepID=A0A0L6CMM8_9MICO|nr:alpha/beta hydrolase [Luteipulveratus halotolerans]KNX38979.1 alpha/beta hydrolase [Luteipulveratus halotolerans]
MTTFLLIPGADGTTWLWHLLVPALDRRGHSAVAVALPPEPTADLGAYADAAVAACEDRDEVVVVAQSLGAFTGPLVCDRVDARALVLLNPMIPSPGETAGDWWQATGHDEARTAHAVAHGRPPEFDVRRDFFHDVPDHITEAAFSSERHDADLETIWNQPWPLDRWPDLPTHVLQGVDDRFFPLELQRRLARERLGMHEIDTMPGGHALALSQPEELADRLVGYAAG